MDTTMAMWLIIGGGALSILYGIWATRSLLAANPGNARMQEIAGAIQEGAQAYLTRQYTTIGIAGVAIFVLVGLLFTNLKAYSTVLRGNKELMGSVQPARASHPAT